jgi:hypothetical protein
MKKIALLAQKHVGPCAIFGILHGDYWFLADKKNIQAERKCSSTYKDGWETAEGSSNEEMTVSMSKSSSDKLKKIIRASRK